MRGERPALMLGTEPFSSAGLGISAGGEPRGGWNGLIRARGRGPGARDALARRPVADGEDVRLYLVEHDLRGLSLPQLASVHRALGEAVRRELRRGSPIRYVQRIDVPEEHRCLCLFE